MQVVVQSLLTNYVRQGKGKTILILHGWGDSVSGLRPLIEILSQTNDVVAVDLPGFGGTQAPNIAWGLDEYAQFIKNFTDKIKITCDVVIGHSNGGAIAIRALANGLVADKLVLLASAGIRGEYKGRIKMLRLATKFGKLITSPLPSNTKKRLRTRVYSSVGSDMLVAEHLQETFKKIVTDDVRSDAQKLSLPTLLIYGDQDSSTPPRIGQQLANEINRSKLIIIPGAGHMLPTEHTDMIVSKIRDFIK